MSEILIYAPNISRENLSGLLNIQLGFLGDKFTISVIKPQSTRFRAPQLRVVLEESDGEMRMEF
nr:hypothetical protein [Calditrichia bacterium]